jgi:hypothetical protein
MKTIIEDGWAVKGGATIFMNTVALTKKGAVENFERRFRNYEKGSWADARKKMGYTLIPVKVTYSY